MRFPGLQRVSAEQAMVVTWMQSDGRLIEHITDATQIGPELRGQAQTLRSPPDRVSLSVEVIAQSDFARTASAP
jgi:hypothetical protein